MEHPEHIMNYLLLQNMIFDDSINIKKIDIPCLRYIADSIILGFRLRPFSNERIIQICSKYCDSDEFREILIKKSIWNCPALLRKLFIQNCLPISEIVSGLKKDPDYISCLFFYKDIPDFLSFVSDFGPSVCPYLSNRTRLDELIEYGFEVGSIGYVLKFDVVESLHDLLDNIDLTTQKIEWSPFETTMQPFTLFYISFAAHFGSLKCFRLLLLNNNVQDGYFLAESIHGGCYEIFHYCYSFNNDYIHSFDCSVEYFRKDIIEWLQQFNDFDNHDCPCMYNLNYLFQNKTIMMKNCHHILDFYSMQSNYDIVEYIVNSLIQPQNHPDVSKIINQGLVFASIHGNLKLVSYFLNLNADPNYTYIASLFFLQSF